MRAVDHIERIGITSRCPSVVRLSLRCGMRKNSIWALHVRFTSESGHPICVERGQGPTEKDPGPILRGVRPGHTEV